MYSNLHPPVIIWIFYAPRETDILDFNEESVSKYPIGELATGVNIGGFENLDPYQFDSLKDSHPHYFKGMVVKILAGAKGAV